MCRGSGFGDGWSSGVTLECNSRLFAAIMQLPSAAGASGATGWSWPWGHICLPMGTLPIRQSCSWNGNHPVRPWPLPSYRSGALVTRVSVSSVSPVTGTDKAKRSWFLPATLILTGEDSSLNSLSLFCYCPDTSARSLKLHKLLLNSSEFQHGSHRAKGKVMAGLYSFQRL